MSFLAKKQKRKALIITASVVVALAIVIGACAIYLGDYYRADEGAIAVFNAEDFEGLILLGSYSTANLSEIDLDVLSIYGSEDKVMNREKYDENKGNLPAKFTEIVVDGGCHVYFGMYGAQDGDGTPTIRTRNRFA
ncbi:MAG: hypothetical protein IJX97_00195 [Clostridia bacterium]|nr:hypothetical protein [Clostridia bacterium]